MQRAFTNILCEDVNKTARFYESLLGMTRHGDFGWFVILTHPKLPSLELGLLDRNHETVPTGMSSAPAGIILTFVVDDVQICYARALEMQADIIEPPTNMPYGQCRLLLRDPECTMIDLSSRIP